MSSIPHISKVALAAGIPARYLYWTGRSGRRYLFTRMEGAEAAALCEGVAIAVSGGQIVWVGGVEAMASESRVASGAAVYVHLLASSEAERRGVIWDLRPVEADNPLPLAA